MKIKPTIKCENKIKYPTIPLPPKVKHPARDHLQAEWRVCNTLWEALVWDALQSAAFYRCADLVECVQAPVAVGRGSP